MRRSALALSTLVLAAAPGSALAQSASDDVYQDPFAGQGQQNGTAGTQSSGTNSGSSSGSGSSGSGSSGSSTPQTPSSAPAQNQSTTTGTDGTATTAPLTEAAAAETATPANELPRTGDDAGTTALAGLGLLLAGAWLRLRARVD